ncbi:hypothetical protein A6X21_08135 [Planctopirus hydrillae]|uniref:Uncharacterized protein n=1 Tax=Planctopirus hydrillae TaxID=1841610 RepID=A0A1C3E8Z4_9PLAN|nr:hypothetical protein A6X21_08135 [Planctopirus hydrillae]
MRFHPQLSPTIKKSQEFAKSRRDRRNFYVRPVFDKESLGPQQMWLATSMALVPLMICVNRQSKSRFQVRFFTGFRGVSDVED